MGDALHAGGSWEKRLVVVEAEEIQENHAPEVCVKRTNAKDVIVVKEGDKFCFPCANETIKLAGKIQNFAHLVKFGKDPKNERTQQ